MENHVTATLIVGGELSNEITSSVKKAPATDTPADNAVTSGADKATTNATSDDDLPEDQVPQRLRGHKTFKEAVVKYRELEAELGRKNNEVGQLRYTVDEMLRLKTLSDGGTVTAKHTPVTTDALLTNPEEAIASVVKRANAEGVGAQSDRLAKLEFEAAKRDFTGRHPTYEKDMADATFIDWVKASPFRTKLAQATVSGSFDAADELFGLYSEVKEAKKPAADAAKAAADAAKAAAAGASLTRPGNGGSSSAAKKGAPPKAGSTDIFSKTELRKLFMHDRDKYNAMGPEIQRAYAEGRVK